MYMHPLTVWIGDNYINNYITWYCCFSKPCCKTCKTAVEIGPLNTHAPRKYMYIYCTSYLHCTFHSCKVY